MSHQDDSDQKSGAEESTAYEQPVVEELETDDGPAVTAAGASGPK